MSDNLIVEVAGTYKIPDKTAKLKTQMINFSADFLCPVWPCLVFWLAIRNRSYYKYNIAVGL